MKIAQLDVTTAFLNGCMDTTVYMEKPKLLEEMLSKMVSEEGKSELGRKAQRMLTQIHNVDCVCKLNKAIYGLKQSGRQWHTKLNDTLRRMGIAPMKANPCVYSDDLKEIFVLTYVDDILIAYHDPLKLKLFREQLGKKFPIKDLGEAKFCLGIEINQLKNIHGTEIRLSQKGYIHDLLKRYGMEDCKPVSTPLAAGIKLNENPDEEED